jgi:hypothetical protein
MAERKSPAGSADFVAKIVNDPKNPPQTLLLKGFLGASSEEGHTRIYFDASLAAYAEIPDDAILHTMDDPAQDGLAATSVWIKREAQLIFGPAGSSRPRGTFLEGAIMQNFMPGATGGGAGAGPQAFYPSLFQVCPSRHPSCGHQTLQAFSFHTINSQGYPCHSYQCGGGGHPTMAIFASPPTITWQGYPCHSYQCGGGGHPTM